LVVVIATIMSIRSGTATRRVNPHDQQRATVILTTPTRRQELGRRQSNLGEPADAERGREQELLDPFGTEHRADEPLNQDHAPGNVTGIDQSNHSVLDTTMARQKPIASSTTKRTALPRNDHLYGPARYARHYRVPA
jgi:hypothetical protein